MSSEEEKPATGYDRNIDYLVMKNRLILEYDQQRVKYKLEDDTRKKDALLRKITYCTVAMIQLRNGSRISEAVEALEKFADGADINDKVTVKIAKSKAIKYERSTHRKYTTKTRFRKMLFPLWVPKLMDISIIKAFLDEYEGDLKRRTCDYLLRGFQCNTHSLRYACINYLLYDQKKEMAIVAKFVGHTGVAQLVRYTQLKESDKIFDLDI